LIALEELADRRDAMARERFLKSRAGIAERQRLFEQLTGIEAVERP
jgi:hypothetical protein